MERRKKRGERNIDGFRKNWGFWNLRCQSQVKHKLKSKIGIIFANENVLAEYPVKIFETHLYLYEYYKKKIEFDENGHKYILFRIDVYFFEHELAVEADEKNHNDIDLIFEEARQEALEKNLIVNILELIQVKKVMTQIMKWVECKSILMNQLNN